MLLIQQPSMQWVDPVKNSAIFQGKMYFGLPRTDPKVLANRVQVYYFDTLGNPQPLPQPVNLSDSGVPTYLGKPVEIYANETCSIRVDDRNGLEKYLVDEYPLRSSEVVGVDSIKSLPSADFATGQYSVTGFYAGSTIGGGVFVWDAARDKADHNGGTVIAPEAAAAWDGTQADLATLLDWTGSGSGCYVMIDVTLLQPEMFGAISKESNNGDLINNSAAFQACVDVMNASTIPMQVEQTYIANSIVSSGFTSISGAGTIYQDNVTTRGFNIELPTTNIGSYTAVSSVALPSPSGIIVSKLSGTFTAAVGDVIQVVDDAILSGTANVRFAETATVQAVDGTGIWLDCVLRHVAYYTTGSVYKLSGDRVEIDGLRFTGTDNAFIGTAARTAGLTVAGAAYPQINIIAEDDIGSGLVIRGCYKPTAHVVAKNLRDRDDLNSYGYGAVCYGCCKGANVTVNATQVRHAYTDGVWDSGTFKSFDNGFVLDSTVRGKAHAVSAATWDTHPYSDNCVFVDAEAYEGKSNFSGNKDNAFAFQLRGTNGRIINGRTDRDKALSYATGLTALIDSADVVQITEIRKQTANNTVSHSANNSGKTVKLTVVDSYLVGIPFSVDTANITPVRFERTTLDNKGLNYDLGTVKSFDYEFIDCNFVNFNAFRLKKGKYAFQGGQRITTTAATGVIPIEIYDGVTVSALNFGAEAQSFSFSSLFLANGAATSAAKFFYSGCYLNQRNGSTTKYVIFTQGTAITLIDVAATAVRTV